MIYLVYNCAPAAPASLTTVSGSGNTTWVQYTYNYTANKTNATLMFAVDGYTTVYIAVDDVSIVDTANPSVQLLENPSFENSTSVATGWNIWCSETCVNGGAGTIITSGCRTSNCYRSYCAGGGKDYLLQSFSTIISHIYTISFWTQRVRFGATTTVYLYVGVV